jgi:serine/threonine protein kinase
VAWVVKVVAEALHYAHGEQTFHRDVKPANVLLTIQHGPQLLDFNLAESPHSASQAQAAMHGGTLPYMAPEQIEAFLNPDLWGKVGAPADIYSLGLVLRELLTGQAPDLPAETLAPARAMRVLLDRRPLLDVSVRRSNPAIPHALEVIAAKCLSVPVADRYCDAGALAQDLDCFLSRRPLVHAVNPSRPERCRNWGIRNRVWLALVGVVLGFCTVSLFAGMVLERARTHTRPTIEITASDELRAAVAALNGEHPQDSTLLLDHLVELYPESSIPRVYRGLAYEATHHDFDAERYFKEAISMSNARSEIVPWSPQDPKLLDRLTRFGNRRFAHAKMIESDNELGESERRTACAVQYMLADLAWDIAREIQKQRPKEEAMAAQIAPPSPAPAPANEIRLDSEMTAYNLALSEQELGKYESVVQRADQAIKVVADQKTPDLQATLRVTRRLFEWRQLRSRALAKWAETLRSEGSTDTMERALKKIAGAEQDLQICVRYADSEGRNSLDLYTLEKIRVAALMTHVEIDIDLHQLKDANLHLNQARKSLKRYDDLAHLVDRTEDIDSKYERLNGIDHRLRQEQARAVGGGPAEPPRVHAGE